MQLHIFEYIVRGALLEWWKWCLPDTPCLNSASVCDLEGIPGIGPKHANNIVLHRSSHGPFATFDDLLAVPGIGQKATMAIKAHTTLVEK